MALENPFVSILTDFGFKKLFADPTDTSFLQKVLQILIPSDIPIRNVHIDNTYQLPDVDKDRGAVYDVKGTDDEKRRFIVEMQRTEVGNFIHRVQFYTYFQINQMVKKGGKIKYDDMHPIYTISFLDGKAYPGEEFHHIARLRNQHGELIDDQITHIMLELGKWNKTEDEIKTDLDKLILLMKFTDTATAQDPIPEVLTKEEWTAQTLEKLRANNLTDEERLAYEFALIKRASLDDINDRVEKKMEQAEQKVEQAEQKVEQAEQKAEQAKQEAEQAKQKAEQAKQKAEQAKQKAEQAKQKAEQVEQKIASAIVKHLKKGLFADEDIAELFNVDIEYVQQLKKQLSA